MKSTLTLLSCGLLFVVAGCGYWGPQNQLGPDFGNSVQHNAAVQIIDPAPDLEGRETPDMGGVRAEGAINRYNTGTVIQPEQIKTTEIGGSN